MHVKINTSAGEGTWTAWQVAPDRQLLRDRGEGEKLGRSVAVAKGI